MPVRGDGKWLVLLGVCVCWAERGMEGGYKTLVLVVQHVWLSVQRRAPMQVKAAVFSMIQARLGGAPQLPEGSRWLDLFAGTGNIGLEVPLCRPPPSRPSRRPPCRKPWALALCALFASLPTPDSINWTPSGCQHLAMCRRECDAHL